MTSKVWYPLVKVEGPERVIALDCETNSNFAELRLVRDTGSVIIRFNIQPYHPASRSFNPLDRTDPWLWVSYPQDEIIVPIDHSVTLEATEQIKGQLYLSDNRVVYSGS